MTDRILLKPGHRIAIINRGEPAVRFLNAVNDYNEEHKTNFTTIALFTKPDQHAKFVQRADVSYLLGDAQEPDPGTVDAAGMPVMKSPYLSYERLKHALIETEANAVWVGWGFVAEHAEFVDLCDSMGIAFIGPTGDSMRALGDKIGSKNLAESSGVAVSPWSKGAVKDVTAAEKAGKTIGYPLVIKATAGGGGRGIRRVMKPKELADAFHSATSEAEKAFGNGACFMEKMVLSARHLEVQVIADFHGTVWPVGIRDCSVQRRNQKVIEEGPAVILTAEEKEKLLQAAVNIARASNYHCAGTAEFLFEPDSRNIYFMEMNTRLQVEHPVTEMTTGVDLVKLQLETAMGRRLEGEIPITHGHAIEVRLNAEDPYNQFAPSPGRIEVFNPPGGPGIRVDSGVETDSEISSAFDSMVAKILAYGRTREEARARLVRAVAESQIVIENGTTNKPFLLELLTHPAFIENKITTRWLDGMMEEGIAGGRAYREVALIVAGIEIYSRLLHEERKDFFHKVARGRPRKLPVASTVEVETKLAGCNYKFEILLLEPEYYRVRYEDKHFDVRFIRDSPTKTRLFYNMRKYEAVTTPRQDDLQIEINGQVYLIERDSGGVLKSNSPAVVLNIQVEPGQHIVEGEPVITLEAMKMEMVFQAPASGVVREIFVKRGDQVGAGDPLLAIEAGEGESDTCAEEATPVEFAYNSLPEKQVDPVHQILRECRDFMMGFDVHHFSFDNVLQSILETVRKICASEHGADELVEFLEDMFNLYFDIEFLFLKRVSVSANDISSPEQNLFIYLQLMGSDQNHPAEDFLGLLDKALAAYGVDTGSQSDVLEEALIRIFYSHDNMGLKHQLLRTVLNAYEALGALSNHTALKKTMEQVMARSRHVHESVYNMAMDFYYQVFEKADYDRLMERMNKELSEHLDKLEVVEDADERESLMLKVTYAPRSLLKFLMNNYAKGSVARRRVIAEILQRRNYMEVELHSKMSGAYNDVVWSTAQYTDDRNSNFNVTVCAPITHISEIATRAARLVMQAHGHQEIILDVFVHSDGALKEEKYAQMMDEMLKKVPVISNLSKIRVVIGDASPLARCFHFVRSQDGYTEKKLFRGLPELLANRFYLERLQGFRLQRLSTEENVYLFHGIAEQNENDQRLLAFHEVRVAPPAQTGDRFSYPALHQGYLMVMKSMRQALDQIGAKGFYWNQVIIYIRPLLHIRREEFVAFLRRIVIGYESVHLEKIRIYALLQQPFGGVANLQVEVNFPGGVGVEFRPTTPTTPLIQPLSQRDFRQALARRRGLNYPYEVINLLTKGYFFKGEFEEFDFEIGNDGDWKLQSVKGRPEGENRYGMVLGLITNFTPLHPEGMQRVLLLGDGNFGLGCLAEPECRYVLAAIELAKSRNIPLEWFSISSGAKISMDNGTENLDWTARVLREIILFTQAGGEINLIVDGINVGAQSYWNAEATMMMHTKGCLIMTPRGCMVLTGKTALDYAGSVSAEDNFGIGGLQRIMGPNGQVHYPANDLLEACDTLFRYYALTYVAPGELYPRPYAVADEESRDICQSDYAFDMTPDFKKVGDIFSDKTNPGKKKPFDMRQVMAAVSDQGRQPLERWPMMQDSDTAVIWDTTLGGMCVSMIGIQSYPIKRHGDLPNDGPDTWTGGTLFPMSSRKIARAINAASGRRPVVILANLSGFDGSPESLRRLQLEFGAEIGRAVVNFEGPLIFSVLSRYHGGAYVVFSNVLNQNLKSIALEGTYASVIGGAPAAVVVFPREVRKRTVNDPRVKEVQEQLDRAPSDQRNQLRMTYREIYKDVHTEKQSEVAAEFDSVHSVERAKKVGSLDEIISPATLRPFLIQQVRDALKS